MGLFTRWRTMISNGTGGTGGSLPSNVLLFEDWNGNESVIIDTSVTPPADTTVPIVTVNPNGGTFASSLNITLTTNETSTIYYTLDGTNPTTSSNVYTTTFSIVDTTTLKYFAKDTAGNLSMVQSVTFTKDTTAPTDTISPALTITPSTTFADSQTVTMSVNEAADIWYTTDGSEPISSATRVKYTSALSLTATTTVKAYAVDTAGNASVVQTVIYTKQSGSGTVLISDTFNRADNATLGNAETGQAWTQYSDANGTVTHGVRSNKFYMSGGTNATVTNRFRKQATQTVSTSNFELQTVIIIPANVSATLAIGLRFVSNTNLLYLQANASGGTVPRYKLTKLPSGGSVTDLASGTKVPTNGDIVKIKHYSSGLIEIYVNDVLDISVTDTYNLSESIKVGLGMDNDTLSFDDFKVTAM